MPRLPDEVKLLPHKSRASRKRISAAGSSLLGALTCGCPEMGSCHPLTWSACPHLGHSPCLSPCRQQYQHAGVVPSVGSALKRLALHIRPLLPGAGYPSRWPSTSGKLLAQASLQKVTNKTSMEWLVNSFLLISAAILLWQCAMQLTLLLFRQAQACRPSPPLALPHPATLCRMRKPPEEALLNM